MVTQRAMTAAARPHGFISSGIGWVASIEFTSVGRSYLNGLLEFSVGGQIALRHNKMVGGSRIEVETIGEPFLRGYCGVRNGCVARSWWVFLGSGCLVPRPYSLLCRPFSFFAFLASSSPLSNSIISITRPLPLPSYI